MCRSIKMLVNFEPPATDDEIHAAALQYVRKVSGATSPTVANRAAFERAVAEITEITRRLVRAELVALALPRTREGEAAKARARGQRREADLRRKILREVSDPETA